MSGGRRLLFLLVVGLGGLLVLLWLGTWQMQRLAWKNGLISELETRLAEAPLSVSGLERMDRHNFRRASAEGAFAPSRGDGAAPARFLTSERPQGPGFRVISAFELASGERILVDRGFVPDQTAIPPAPSGSMRLSGALHWPREKGGFTPEPAIGDGRWFAREVPELAQALGTRPVMLVLSERASGGGEWPRPSPVTVDLPNDHLGYAITWYGLAAVWLVMSGALFLRGRS